MLAVTTVIELYEVWKQYGDLVALRDVSLKVAPGEVVMLSGPSGAGKSTLLRLLYASERADRGIVKVGGRDVGKLRHSAIPFLRRNIGVVFQDFKLLRDRSTGENVSIAVEVLGLSRREARDKTELALGAVGLGGRFDTPVARLSGGEQQRVAIARAIVATPEIVLADEPTGNLDPDRAGDLLELFDRQRGRGVTVVIATHDPDVVAFGAGRGWRRVMLDEGFVIEPRAVPVIEQFFDDVVTDRQTAERAGDGDEAASEPANELSNEPDRQGEIDGALRLLKGGG